MTDTPDPDKDDATAPDPDGGAKKALQAEREARRAAEKELRDLREANAEREAAEIRARVVAEKGLTPAQALRIKGETEEELAQDADDLLAAFAPPDPPPDRQPRAYPRGGNDPTVDTPPSAAGIADKILGSPL